MIDVHCHILPNVDDGSKSLVDTRDLLNKAVLEGISDILITPHFSRVDGYLKKAKELQELFNQLKQDCLDLSINLYLGNELMIDKDLDDLLLSKDLLTLNNSKYVLVEFPFNEYKSEYSEYLRNIELSGYKIIIAHPERYKWVLDNPDKYINRWINKGYYIQCNQSFMHHYKQKRFVFNLIKQQKIHLIASDGHNINRPITLIDAYNLITKHFNKEISDILFNDNPRRLLDDKELLNVDRVKEHIF